MSAVLEPGTASASEAPANAAQAETIDAFHLVIEALKLNGINKFIMCRAFRSRISAA